MFQKMLAVVVTDVEGAGEYEFQRRRVTATPDPLRGLAEWFLEQDVQEVVMESTAQYWRPVWEALERYWQPGCQSRTGTLSLSGSIHLAQAKSNRAPGGRRHDFADAERLIKRLVAQELTLSLSRVRNRGCGGRSHIASTS